jgi:pimeloyl-ACP methyl ester carboxylesterase
MITSLSLRAVAAGVVACSLTTATSAAAATAASPECRQIAEAVAMAPDTPADQRIAGTLCVPRGRAVSTVQVLLPGGTYDRAYWTRRADGHQPSYTERMTRAGYATLAIDRIGTGRSSYPPSTRFVDQSHDYTVHQVIQRLRRTGLGDGRQRRRGFARVILVGHSFGATIARMLAVTHPGDVDGLILTGEGTQRNLAIEEELLADYHPANQDPRLIDRQLDDGYFTLKPDREVTWLYHRPSADPKVIAWDEGRTEPDVFPQGLGYGAIEVNRRIRVPVLVVIGQHDRLMCGQDAADCRSSATLMRSAAPLYGPDAELEAILVRDTGHVLNLHRTTRWWQTPARVWADRHVKR